jgi:hypothetical protein
LLLSFICDHSLKKNMIFFFSSVLL